MKKSILLIIASFIFFACTNKHKTYTIGVLQCSEDVWRQYMNDALRTASYQYDNVEIKFVSTKDNSIEQKNQINRLID